MNFYIIFVSMLIILDETKPESNSDLIVSKAGIDNISPCSIGIVFFVTLNNTSNENDYDVELTPDRCCLDEGFKDCDTLQIMGRCRAFIPMGTMKTLKLVAPILDPFEREGYCEIYLDSKLDKQRNKRELVKINFDTTVENNEYATSIIKRCAHKDEDPLNNCKPVVCERYYNGKKTFYNRRLKRCVEAPACMTVDDVDYPELIYNPISNKCEKRSLETDDINVLKKYVNNDNRQTKDIILISDFPDNGTYTKDYADSVNTLSFEKFKEAKQLSKMDKHKSKCFKLMALNYIRSNKWTLIIFGLVILLQCAFICSILYCITKGCECFKEKKVVRKFFNYRNDVSVTTPLIATSNMDTETVDFHYLSESSANKDQKIKCYKACQKPEAIKPCMSDDILSKCLNRRDWKNYHKSDVIPELHDIFDEKDQIKDMETHNHYSCTVPQIVPKVSKKSSEIRVVFQDEKSNTCTYNISKPKVVTIVSNTENKESDTRDSDMLERKSSEKELKCHSYNCVDANITGSKLNSMKKSGIFRSEKSRKDTVSTEKGAQAYFSNDSLEDFLSERGVMYLANENMSKYTFSGDSNEVKPINSNVSSKTSKNFIKNVLSLLHKRSRQGPLSDPGKTKNLDLELLHMSRASVYTSSHDESECMNNLKRGDSRTSF